MTSTVKAEPLGSTVSLPSEQLLCTCGHPHGPSRQRCGWRYTDSATCPCMAFRLDLSSPAGPVPLSEAPLYEAAKKAHDERRAVFQAVADRAAEDACCPPACSEGHTYSGSCALRSEGPIQPEEPPLTPEEEEERVSPQLCHCGIGTPEECATGPAGCGPNSLDSKPPQPDAYRLTEAGERVMSKVKQRRPPYAVAYSVDGALYEVALPGDATVTAVDGALVIKHSFGQVAGIVGIQPIEHKEAS